MLNPRIVVVIVSVGLMALGVGVVSGQPYPNKPIRVVTSAPAGNTDLSARVVAQGLAASMGQPTIVENRTASAYYPGEVVAKAPADGYTLLFQSDFFWIGPLLKKAPPPYDPVKDFSPITLVATSPQVLALHPSVPAKTVKELIAVAKARPGQINYASTGVGSGNHLAAELFNYLAGVKTVHVPYTASAFLLSDLLSGQVQMRIGSGSLVMPHAKTGKLRVLAVTTAQPTELFPGMPTIAESLPGFEYGTTLIMFAPAKTPSSIIAKLNQEIQRVLKQPDVKEKLFNEGTGIIGGSPAQAVTLIKNTRDLTAKVMKSAGIIPD